MPGYRLYRNGISHGQFHSFNNVAGFSEVLLRDRGHLISEITDLEGCLDTLPRRSLFLSRAAAQFPFPLKLYGCHAVYLDVIKPALRLRVARRLPGPERTYIYIRYIHICDTPTT